MKHALPLIERHTSIKETIQKIERTPFATGFLINEQGVYLGGIFQSDLRRLLISGVNAEAEVGAYPVKYTYRLEEPSLRDRARVDALLADLRLHGVTYVPVVSSIGEIQDILSADDLTSARPSEQPGSQREREKRVLVVGGAGYLGSILTRKL
ncbi:MAG TPA: hypothetical protein VLT13_07670, partial [Bacteroidota bacterium]|nr:hypothetical protein [Bacteroidota bacterium]